MHLRPKFFLVYWVLMKNRSASINELKLRSWLAISSTYTAAQMRSLRSAKIVGLCNSAPSATTSMDLYIRYFSIKLSNRIFSFGTWSGAIGANPAFLRGCPSTALCWDLHICVLPGLRRIGTYTFPAPVSTVAIKGCRSLGQQFHHTPSGCFAPTPGCRPGSTY